MRVKFGIASLLMAPVAIAPAIFVLHAPLAAQSADDDGDDADDEDDADAADGDDDVADPDQQDPAEDDPGGSDEAGGGDEDVGGGAEPGGDEEPTGGEEDSGDDDAGGGDDDDGAADGGSDDDGAAPGGGDDDGGAAPGGGDDDDGAVPGAYEGVVGVTAVDGSNRVYRYANRGTYVDFSARGVAVPAIDAEGGVRDATGTSFAAPVIAARLAAQLRQPDPAASQRAIRGLEAQARDLGAPGRDPIFGVGLIEEPK